MQIYVHIKKTRRVNINIFPYSYLSKCMDDFSMGFTDIFKCSKIVCWFYMQKNVILMCTCVNRCSNEEG